VEECGVPDTGKEMSLNNLCYCGLGQASLSEYGRKNTNTNLLGKWISRCSTLFGILGCIPLDENASLGL